MKIKFTFLILSLTLITISCKTDNVGLMKNSRSFVNPSSSNQANKLSKSYQKNETQDGSNYRKDLEKIRSLTESRKFKDLVKMIDYVEKEWLGDIKAKTYLLAEISNSFSSYDFSNPKQYVYSVNLAKKVLEHSDSIPVELELEMVSHLEGRSAYFYNVTEPENWGKDRQERIKYLLHFYRRVKNNIDLNFDFYDKNNYPLGKVLEPSGKYRSGISPDAIKEPEIKKKYIEAIEANRIKSERLNEQLILHRLYKRLPSMVERFLIEFYSTLPEDTSQLKQDFETFNLDEESRQKILKNISEIIKEKQKQANGI